MFSLNDLKAFEVKTTGCLYGGADCATGAGSWTSKDGTTTIKWSADTDHGNGSQTWHTNTDKSEAPLCPVEVLE